jgi:hypothetical protein
MHDEYKTKTLQDHYLHRLTKPMLLDFYKWITNQEPDMFSHSLLGL